MPSPSEALLAPAEFVERLRREGSSRYHDEHPFHVRMHEGSLTRAELQRWVANRYYYQTRIPIKDALILAKSGDPAFRRAWIRRIHDHDGDGADSPGGLEQWLRLAVGVGLDREAVASCRDVLPGVRFACDGYVNHCRRSVRSARNASRVAVTRATSDAKYAWSSSAARAATCERRLTL